MSTDHVKLGHLFAEIVSGHDAKESRTDPGPTKLTLIRHRDAPGGRRRADGGGVGGNDPRIAANPLLEI
jgi:hypothetical protein